MVTLFPLAFLRFAFCDARLEGKANYSKIHLKANSLS